MNNKILPLLQKYIKNTKDDWNYITPIDFYNDYFTKYYPKALVICHQVFVHMKPEEIAKALQVIMKASWKK